MIDIKKAKELLECAVQARQGAYAPYSNFYVGAALLCDDGEIVTGANVENASFGAGICAERCAIFSAVAKGKKNFSAIAIVGGKAGGPPTEDIYPCGICRQVISEFCSPDLDIIVGHMGEARIHRLGELLPYAFTSESL